MNLRIAVPSVLLFVVLGTVALQPHLGAEPSDGVFIHVSHGPEDPHRVLMALNMAAMMAASRDVLVYFDITGVDAVLSSTEDFGYEPFPNLKAQLATLREAGVTLMACPGCLAAAGHEADDLADGVQVAEKDGFFAFTEGRILTLDY